MKNNREIRWLQLSDLHMFDSAEVIRQKKELYKNFKEIDFFIITGDLHQYGTDYSLSKQFLEELVYEMQVDRRDIVIIPGNHDVRSTDQRREIIEKIDHKLENNPHYYAENLDNLLNSFKEYTDFLNNFYGDAAHEFVYLENNIYVWNDKVAILCLNTALISDENHFKPQIIDIKGLEKIENTIYPCIAIMHHDYYDISDMHKPYLQARMKELGVSAVLSGHKHRHTTNEIGLGNGENIPNYCCAKSVSEPGDLWSDVGLIEYRWNMDKDVINVIPYVWDNSVLHFIPSVKFEDRENIQVDDNGRILLKRCFSIRKINGKRNNRQQIQSDKKILSMKDLQNFIADTQDKYLDGILKKVGNDKEKFKYAIDIMKKIACWYDEREIEFEDIMKLVISCEQKYVLAINGLQGTGKSTFLSLIYYQMMEDYQKTNLFPILIDLHYFEKFTKHNAKKFLQEDLKKISDIIKKYAGTRFLLMFDGADEYIRRTSELEEILHKYVNSHNEGNFAFCIGSAEKLPNEMIKGGPLQVVSRKATYKIKTHQLDKRNYKDIAYIIKRLCVIYGFNSDASIINNIQKVVNVYTINAIDYRTLLIILRVFDAVSVKNRNLQLGSYFYEYYINEMNGDERVLIKHAKAAYDYTVHKDGSVLTNLKHAKIIYNNGITRDFLLAFYFVHLIKNAPSEQLNILKSSNFVFTASVNKFIKDLLLNKYRQEQYAMVQKLIKAYSESNISMKSQICYILGRFEDGNAKSSAKKFLMEKWNDLYDYMFKDNILILQQPDIKSELVLFRTISVSLIWLECYEHQERFLKCIIMNEKLNQINRGFHLEYFEDKAYINGESPTYVDDEHISVDKTMQHLIYNINKGFEKEGSFNKSINLDIITLFSIYQYRIKVAKIKEEYESVLLEIANKILESPKIQSKTITNYVSTMKELLPEKPYLKLLHELYQVKNIKREGWVRRSINLPESIADHMYCCYILGVFFLPNKIQHCIDYEIPNIDDYMDYSKDKILQMLLMHDLAEVKIGDIISYEKIPKDVLNESRRFNYYEFLCSFPKIYGLGNRKALWDEFEEKSTINAKIANDIDKIEPVIQAAIYKENGNEINLKEWIDYACQNVCTTLGKQFLDFVIDSFCNQIKLF